jgi:hypothetical protein
MSRIDKKLESMRNSPQKDWKIEDLKTIADRFDIKYRQPGTSHVTFVCFNNSFLTVPARKPIKAIYIRRFVEMIDVLQKGENYD